MSWKVGLSPGLKFNPGLYSLWIRATDTESTIYNLVRLSRAVVKGFLIHLTSNGIWNLYPVCTPSLANCDETQRARFNENNLYTVTQ